MSDVEDDDFIENPDEELPLVLASMNNSIRSMLDELNKNATLGRDTYLPEMQRRLVKYNI